MNLNTTVTAMDLGDVLQVSVNPSVVTPMIERDLGELIARAVTKVLIPFDAQFKML